MTDKQISYEIKRNNKRVKDALGHLRSVKKGYMPCRRWGRVVAAICELEDWEKLPHDDRPNPIASYKCSECAYRGGSVEEVLIHKSRAH